MVYDLPPPQSWEQFEDLCKSLFEVELSLTDIHRYAKQGQRQNGVDISGFANARTMMVGIQCKKKQQWPSRTLDVNKDIIDEIELARKFCPQLRSYYIVTTADRDKKYNDALNAYLHQNSNIPFEVKLFCWPDINALVNSNNFLINKYYAPFFSPTIPLLSQRLSISPGPSAFYVMKGTVFSKSAIQLTMPNGRATLLIEEGRVTMNVNSHLNVMFDRHSVQTLGHIYINLQEIVDLAGFFFENKESVSISIRTDITERIIEIVNVCQDNLYGYEYTSYSGCYYFNGDQAYNDNDLSLPRIKNEELRSLYQAMVMCHEKNITLEGLIK